MGSGMKPFIIAFLIMAAVPCAAKNIKLNAADENYSSDLMNLNYYPHKGWTEFNPRVSTEFHDYTETSRGQTTTIARNTVTLAATYGWIHRIQFSLLETLLWDQNLDSHTAQGVETEATSQGLSNPTITALWRFLENGKTGLSGEFGVDATPSFGSKVAGDGKNNRDGNNLSGNSSAGVALAFYWRTAFNELGIAFTVNHNSAGHTEATTAATSFDSAPYWSSSVTLNERIHIGANFFTELGGTGFLPNQSNQTTDDRVERISNQPFYINPHLLLGFSPDPDVVLTLNLMSHHAITSVNSSRTGVETTSENTAIISTVGLLHQF